MQNDNSMEFEDFNKYAIQEGPVQNTVQIISIINH